MKKILEKIFSYQKSFLNDKVFDALKQQFLDLLGNIEIDNVNIILGSIYSEDEEIKNHNNITILPFKNKQEENDILIEIESDNYSYAFEIFKEQVSYSGYYYDSDLLIHTESYDYKRERGLRKLTKISEVIDRNDCYEDYSIEITSIDKKGNTKKDITEENKIFGEKFGIDLEKAEFYRRHFKENKNYINECKVRSEMEYEDNASSNEWSFSMPFNITDLDLVFNFDFDTNEEHLYQALSWIYTLEDLEVARQRIEFLKELLINVIEKESEIIIENNLYLNLSAFIYNSSTEFLTTKGRIVKKINGKLYLYIIEIKNNQITYLKKDLTLEEASNIYDRNIDVEGLKEFLEINRHR